MKIYCTHATTFDYKNEFYEPLKKSELNQSHELFFPHETDLFINSKEIIKSCNLVLAEVSYPSTGMGIELGWADAFNIPIIAAHKNDSDPSKSLGVLTKHILPYDSMSDLTGRLQRVINLL